MISCVSAQQAAFGSSSSASLSVGVELCFAEHLMSQKWSFRICKPTYPLSVFCHLGSKGLDCALCRGFTEPDAAAEVWVVCIQSHRQL